MDERLVIKQEEITLGLDFQAGSEHKYYDLIIKKPLPPALAELLKQKILQGQKALELIENKMFWLSTWEGTNTENGRIYKVLEEISAEIQK